jgi:hypothetical protein
VPYGSSVASLRIDQPTTIPAGRNSKMALGRFRPDELGSYYVLMTRCATCAPPPPGDGLALDESGRDWLGGRWQEIGLFAPRTFFNRTDRRIEFDAAGNLVKGDPRGMGGKSGHVLF